MQGCSRFLLASATLIATIGYLMLDTASAGVQSGPTQGWTTEPGFDPPGYAVAELVDSNLDIDSVALVCNEGGSRRYLDLEIFPSKPGPLLPAAADPRRLKERPGVEIEIDGRVFPAELLFADAYGVVADSQEGSAASLSDTVLDAMGRGRVMVLRFDLLQEEEGQPRADAKLVLDLQGGGAAIAAVRRCASAAQRQASR